MFLARENVLFIRSMPVAHLVVRLHELARILEDHEQTREKVLLLHLGALLVELELLDDLGLRRVLGRHQGVRVHRVLGVAVDCLDEVALQLLEHAMRAAEQAIAAQHSLVLDGIERARDVGERVVELALYGLVAALHHGVEAPQRRELLRQRNGLLALQTQRDRLREVAVLERLVQRRLALFDLLDDLDHRHDGLASVPSIRAASLARDASRARYLVALYSARLGHDLERLLAQCLGRLAQIASAILTQNGRHPQILATMHQHQRTRELPRSID